MGAVYTVRVPFSKRIGGQLNYAENVGVITDALVAANATLTLLKAALLAPTYLQIKARADLRLALDSAVDLSLIPETHACTTVAGLVALTDASTTLTQNYFG
jgi:hypothetical protein